MRTPVLEDVQRARQGTKCCGHRPFNNVKMLSVKNELFEELARSLCSEDEEMPLDILSNLKELRFSGGDNNDDVSMPSIKQQPAEGHPVNLNMVDPSQFPRYLWL
jgi:hypothetical protein